MLEERASASKHTESSWFHDRCAYPRCRICQSSSQTWVSRQLAAPGQLRAYLRELLVLPIVARVADPSWQSWIISGGMAKQQREKESLESLRFSERDEVVMFWWVGMCGCGLYKEDSQVNAMVENLEPQQTTNSKPAICESTISFSSSESGALVWYCHDGKVADV